jgi:transcriptional regulator with XRE-family HTH domain
MELSQEGLASRTDLHWSYIGQVERGQSNLTLHNILRLAAVLEVDAGDLVAGLKPPPI